MRRHGIRLGVLKEWEGLKMATERNIGTGADRTTDHPDRQAVDDWFAFGPKNGKIEELGRELTRVQGLRVSDGEGLIVSALEVRWQSFMKPSTQPEGG